MSDTLMPEVPVRQVRVVDAPLVDPSAHMGILSVLQNPYLLRLLVVREIKQRYAGSFMGLIWSYINPLIQFGIYWFVMGEILGAHKSIPAFPLHIFSAFIIVHFFTETFAAGTRSIVANRGLVKKLPIPRELFPVAAALVSLYQVMPAMLILLVADVLSGWRPDKATLIASALALGIVMFLGLAVSLLFAVANVYFRDFGSVVGILNHFVRFGVPMVWAYSMIFDKYGSAAPYFIYNPLFDAVLLMQRAFWVGATPDRAHTLHTEFPPGLWIHSVESLGIAAVILVIAQIVFTKLDARIPERL
jgi:ABC-2 type transport system permease protein